MTKAKILFFNINGSGMGHMNRCLSYARALQGKADITFFSLASAIEIIEGMNQYSLEPTKAFEAEYYISQFWTTNSNYTWNTELAFRLSITLEHVQPDVIVFDGTWPYNGFLGACKTYGKAKLVWSNRGLLKKDVRKAPVDTKLFDLILEPGELLSSLDTEIKNLQENQPKRPYKVENKLHLSPVTLFRNEELLDKENARKELGLEQDKKYALLSLGPGNLKDIHGIGHTCIELLQNAGYTILWTCPPISVNDVELPDSVIPLSVYPLIRVMRAFDIFVGAAGYNTCCEVVQAQVPTLLLPNTLLADDQARRAYLVAENSPTIVCTSENKEDLEKAIQELLKLKAGENSTLQMDGANEAAEALLELSQERNNQSISRYEWTNGPRWNFVWKYYLTLSKLQQQSIIGKSLYLLFNIFNTCKVMSKMSWQTDLKHNIQDNSKQTLLIWSEGLDKESQRILCQEVKNYIKENPQYIPVLITDLPDFTYFSRIHWLVEYLPNLKTNNAIDYKEVKRHYLKWRYRAAVNYSDIKKG